MALAVLCVSLLIVSLDGTVLNVALPTLVRKLHASSSDLQWIVDAYVVLFAGLMLVAGSLADRVGRKRTFLAGLVAFAACSTWAALSGSVGMLIAARASMGFGAALIMPSTLAIITNTFTDPHDRRRAIGLWGATSGAGIALGPIIGGLLLAHFWWGSVFLINVPIAAVGFVCALPLVPDSRNPEARPPDLAGSLLSIAGLGLLLCAIIEAPVHGWSSTLVTATGIGGLVIVAAFVYWERVAAYPMLNLRFFRDRNFSAAVTSVGLVMFAMLGAFFVLTQFLQLQLGYTPLQAGVRTLPAAGAIALAAPLSSEFVRVVGTKLTIATGLLCATAGLWLISGATVTTTYGGIVAGLALVGVGAGLVIPSATASVMGSLPRAHTGVGSATNGTFLQVGGALGIAVIGSLLSNRYQDRLTSALAPYHLPGTLLGAVHGTLGSALSAAHGVGGTIGAEIARAARAAFMSGMDLGLTTAAIVALGAAAIALVTLPRRAPVGGRQGNTPETASSHRCAPKPGRRTASGPG